MTIEKNNPDLNWLPISFAWYSRFSFVGNNNSKSLLNCVKVKKNETKEVITTAKNVDCLFVMRKIVT